MVTTLRALVMLAVLVGLPAAWIYYGPLPPQAQAAVDRCVAAAKEVIQGGAPAPPRARMQSARAADEAPRFAGDVRPAAATASEAAPPRLLTETEAPPLAEVKSSAAEQFEPLLAQLRQFGVAGYALERWGAGGALYRFRCEMPLAGDGALTQQFEAVAADPQLSIAQVVTEVSQWRLAARGAGR